MYLHNQSIFKHFINNSRKIGIKVRCYTKRTPKHFPHLLDFYTVTHNHSHINIIVLEILYTKYRTLYTIIITKKTH